ncbi:hypothetical protein ES708_09131 [subsurface metagenome]
MKKKIFSISFALVLVLCVSLVMAVPAGAVAAVTVETVPVGNPGNAADGTGYGAVAYAYDIGKYEVTAGQYTVFLNAVAGTDPYGLYNTGMDSYGCRIERTGTDGNYSYSVAPDWADRPVNFVSFWDACRFANWLHNGQGSGDTETGAYTLTADGITNNTVTRNEGWQWAVASEDEWYKAAYHDGLTGNYFDYPTASDSMPSNDLLAPDGGNNANFWQDGDYALGGPYYRTLVGEFELSESPYGTFDQGGNVWEWNDPGVETPYRCLRGGSFAPYMGAPPMSYYFLGAELRGDFLPTKEFNDIGFRVVLQTAPPVPSEVWVDDDYTAGSCGGHTWLYDSFTNIQNGIDAVAEGGTVNVAAGTYSEQVNIEKSLTITGAGQDTTHIVSPDPTTMTIYDYFGCKGENQRYIVHRGTNIPVVRIAASDVTFEGFHVDLNDQAFFDVLGTGSDPAYSKGVGILVDHVETTPGTPDAFTGIIIQNNKVDGLLWDDYSDCIKVLAQATVNINHNTLYGYGESAISAQGMDTPRAAFYPTVTANDNTMYGGSGAREGNHYFFGVGYWSGATGSADGNTIYNAPNSNGYALNSWTPNPVSFTNNIILTDGGTVGGLGAQLYESSNLVFSGNDVQDQGLAGAIAKVNDVGGPVITITNNNITNCIDGFIGDGLIAGSVTLHYNNFSGIAGGHYALDMAGHGVSIWGSADPCTITADATCNWWGDASGPYHATNPLATGNEVSDNVCYSPWLGATIDTTPMTFIVDDIGPPPAAGYIQTAINAANPGDTINVAAGTYTEGLIIIDKDLSIVGDPLDKPVITPTEDTGTSLNEKGWFRISDATVNFENLVFDGTGKKIWAAIIYQEEGGTGGTVENCDFLNIRYDQYKGRAIAIYGPYVEVLGCTFTNIERVGILIYGVHDPTTALIKGCTYTGKGDVDALDYAFEVSAGASATIEDSIVTACTGVASSDGSTSAGIYVHGKWAETSATYATITGNTISDTSCAIAVGYSQVTDESVVEAHFNNIEGNDYGVESYGPQVQVDATNNWWGDASGPGGVGPGTGNEVSTNVDYDPWLGASVEDSKSQTVTNDTVDATDEADTEVVVAGTATVTVTQYSSNPGTGFGGDTGKYIDVHIDDPSGVTEIEIRVYYTDAEITGLVETSLILRWWDGTSWIACSDRGVNTTDDPPYSGYMWAKIRNDTIPTLAQLSGTPFGGGGTKIGLFSPTKYHLIIDMLGEITQVEIDYCLNTTLEECEAYDAGKVHLLELEYDTLIRCGDYDGCDCYPKIIVMSLSDESITPPEGMAIVGDIYDFTGYKDTRRQIACQLATYFDPVASVLLNYDPALLPPGATDPVIAFYNHDLGQWVILPPDTGRVAEVGVVSGLAAYFASPFAVLVNVLPPPPTTPEPPAPAPAHFVASGLSILPAEIKVGENVIISLNVANDGEETGTYIVELKINGQTIDSQVVTLDGGQSESVSFTVTETEAGQYEVTVSGLSGSFGVVKTSIWWIFIIIAAVVIIGGLLAWRFRKR